MKIPKDELSVYYDHGVDLKNRRVFLKDDIDGDSITTVIQGILALDSMNDKHEAIELWVGSYGGSEYDMFALHDATRFVKSPIITVAFAKCMSAAPLLVACGKKGERYATPNTYFMIHQSWWESAPQRLEGHQAEISHYKDMDDRWTRLMSKYTNKDEKFWRSLCRKNHDYYFDANKAIELGIVDHLWSEKDDE